MVSSLTFFGEKNQNKTQPSVAKQTCPPCLGLAFMTGKVLQSSVQSKMDIKQEVKNPNIEIKARFY